MSQLDRTNVRLLRRNSMKITCLFLVLAVIQIHAQEIMRIPGSKIDFIEGRYPESLLMTLSVDAARQELQTAGEVFQWLMRQL